MQSTTARTAAASIKVTLSPKTSAAITTTKPPVTQPAETNAVITGSGMETEPVEITETGKFVVESTAGETTVFTETAIADIGGEYYMGRGGNAPNLIILIVIIILAALGGGIYFYWKKKISGSKTSDGKTAQNFINVRDTGDKCLYTVDEKVFVYIKIDGISLELYEAEEIQNMSKSLAAELIGLHFPKKFLTVSRPMELKATLQKYTDLKQNATVGHKALLDQEISELVAMAERGETLERQHYAIVWGEENEEEAVKKNADDLLKALTDSGISAEILDKDGIAGLCNVVNIPAYSHMENSWDFGNELLEAIIR